MTNERKETSKLQYRQNRERCVTCYLQKNNINDVQRAMPRSGHAGNISLHLRVKPLTGLPLHAAHSNINVPQTESYAQGMRLSF